MTLTINMYEMMSGTGFTRSLSCHSYDFSSISRSCWKKDFSDIIKIKPDDQNTCVVYKKENSSLYSDLLRTSNKQNTARIEMKSQS